MLHRYVLITTILGLAWTAQAARAQTVGEKAHLKAAEAVERDEVAVFERLAANEEARLLHQQRGQALDRGASRAVQEFNQAGEMGETEWAELMQALEVVRRRRADLLPEHRRIFYEQQVRHLHERARDFGRRHAELDARVKRTQALLERMKKEGLHDAQMLKALEKEYEASLERFDAELIYGLAANLLGNIDIFHRTDLRRWSGDRYAHLRSAVTFGRQFFAPFHTNDPLVQFALQRARIAANGARAAQGVRLDGFGPFASPIAQALAGEVAMRTRTGEALLHRFGSLRSVERALGRTVWAQSAALISLGEMNIRLWAIRRDWKRMDQEAERISAEAATRAENARNFQSGGRYFEAYQQAIDERRIVRQEQVRCLAQAREVQRQLERDKKARR